jgi:beta-ureidopropionase / N-carbamoyl-L-amino-acid hydrolase
VISAAGIAARLAPLDEIGVGPGGVRRMAWSEEDAASGAWFSDQARGAGLVVQRDPAGNLWACPEREPPWWGVGSHLDSVSGGGRFDGPLGVACGFEIAAASERPMAVIAFADEEGARFNTPTFGSKALTGRLEPAAVLSRRDHAGVTVADAMRDAGVDPGGLADAPGWLSRLAGFVELHIDQSTDVARAGVPFGIVSSLAARLRLEVELRGRADHSGTTPPSERRDALAAAARLIVAAQDSAGDVIVTTTRLLVEPNAPTTIPAEVRLWVDARALAPAEIERWLSGFEREASQLEERTGVAISVGSASKSDATPFPASLRSRLARAGEAVLGRAVPEVVCFAGHDAGVLAAKIRAAMVLVRNPTGVSHSPEESVELEDAAVAARVVADALADAEAG